MPMLDVFNTDAFSVRTLTDAIIKAPYKPGRIGKLALFTEKGIPTTAAVIEEKDGRLSLIPTSPRGGPGSTIGTQRRRARSLVVPHLERDSKVLADEVQNIRAFGSENAVQSVQDLVNDRMTDLRAMHEVTLEHMRAGAIKGQVLDADESVLFDLFAEFNVSQLTGEIEHDGTDTRSDIVSILRKIELNLGGDIAGVTGYRAFCGDDFFDTLVELTDVKASLQFQESIQLRTDLRSGFQYGGVTWENYKGRMTTGGTPFFADDKAYIFPEGSAIFKTYFAPADFIETVNTMGLPIYAKIALDPEFNRFAKIHTQSNPLAICLRPDAVAEVTFGS